MLIIFYLTVVVSELSRKNDRLTQEITLIKKRMEELERSGGEKD
jgi:FtsZ-binding cell division protein ZapB